MTDNRSALPKEYILSNNGINYQIVDEIGRGANCIVYNAIYSDSTGLKHFARVKEFYPIYLLIVRNENFEICCDESHSGKFEAAKRRFETTYETNVKFRNTYGTMNSTVNTLDQFCANGSIYVVMNLDEGTDYRSYSDGSLVEIMTHVKALALVINKYHTDGYLHLDIKPENVFVIPETAEHVYLFDFDSVCKIDDLRSKKTIDISYSEGFSAPEQVQGKILKIGTRTDIYSIGALLFFKLFNRKPTFEECRYSSKFNYKEMAFYDERLRPAFYRCLDELLHKTLATSTSLRWNSMRLVIEALEELEKLSDIEATYLIDTFTYNSAYFIGRSDELEELHEKIQDNNVLFLSGMGGIGKTEIAKKFISEYRDEYDTVAFAYFQKSIEHTVCQDILVNNMSMDDEEEEKDYFSRVLEVLRKSTTGRDLILLDNFDVERDDKLEDLLKCPCKFLITTRNRNIRDWNYSEVKIDRMDDEGDLRTLFEIYNDELYEGLEYDAIGEIIAFVDGHTMTVELISKYLRDSGQKPSVLYQHFKEKSGVTNTDNCFIVNQRKDYKMNSENVNKHLSILFDVFDFDNVSNEVISSLSLFAGIRINRERFESLCSVENITEHMNKLIRGGWIELNEIAGKISLHQVIQDLIYMKLKPTTASCPHIATGMYKYIKENTDNYSERRTKKKVFEIFTDRISGDDIPYAKLCLEYGKKDKIEKAIAICKRIGNNEANSVLADLYIKSISDLCSCQDMFDSDDSLEEYGQRQVMKIDEQFGLAVEAYKRAHTRNQDESLPGLIRLASKMDSLMSDFLMNSCFDDVEKIDSVYQKIIEIFNKVDRGVLDYEISYDEKERLLEIARDFYSDGDYCAMYRWEHYCDFEKVEFYQELLGELREIEKSAEDDYIICVDPGERSYSEMADWYMDKGKYETAIAMYKKAYEEENELLEISYSGSSKASLKLGKVDDAIDYLERALNYDKECIANKDIIASYSGYICIDLIKLLVDLGRTERAIQYARELILYQEPKIKEEEENSYYIKNVLVAKWYLYLLEDEQLKKELMWDECKALLVQLGNAELDEEHLEFVKEFLRIEGDNLEYACSIIDRTNLGYGNQELKIQLIEEYISLKRNLTDFKPYHIKLLLKCAEMTCDFSYKGTDNPFDFCVEAEELLDNMEDEDGYYRNKIINLKAEIISNDNTYDYDEVNAIRKQCNYYVIAEHESENVDKEKKIELWNDAADKYSYVDDYENQIKCLEWSYALMVPILNQYDYSRFDYHLWYIMYNQVIAWIKLSNRKKASDLIREMYLRTLDYYEDKADDRQDCLYKIKEIADLYEQSSDYQKALTGYLIWLYVSISDKCDGRFLKNYFTNIQDVKKASEELVHIISSEKVDEVDNLIDFKDKVEKLNIDSQEMHFIQPLLDVITSDFQNKDVEFK